MREILFVHSRELCYYSSEFFLSRMEEAHNKTGADTIVSVHCIDDFSDLEVYEGRTFDAVVDINSKLPYLTDEKGDFWLSRLRAPFFNYILDHPLYHHPGLSFQLPNYHAIAIDRFHHAYMEKYYPHLESVSYLPLVGTRAINPKPYETRSVDFLFPGTYIYKEVIQGEMKSLADRFGPDYGRVVSDLLEEWDSFKEPLESALVRYLNTESKDPEDYLWEGDFPTLLNSLYMVDRIKRNDTREKILLALSKEIPLHIMGEGWEDSLLSPGNNITLLKPRPYANSLEVFGDSKVVIDITPAFLASVHDRTASIMANGALCFTNMPITACSDIKNGGEALYFDGENPDKALDILLKMGEPEREKIADRGYLYYKNNLTWEAHAGKLLEIIKNTK